MSKKHLLPIGGRIMILDKESKKIILIGKFSEVSFLLKQYQSKYKYLQELIDALNSEENNNSYIN